ncbi:MAG TPA: platelet-activating factor acetylhydrolase IB subunit [Pirellulales bacterium]|jgi:beta-glucosidase
MRRPFAQLLVIAAVLCSFLSVAVAKDPPDTVTPVPRDGGWMQRHQSFNERAKQGDVDVIFLGDSITQGWEGKDAAPIWNKYYGARKAMNAGIGGDRTQHVLWRLENGNIAGIKPKLAVIMIGTNNAGANTSEDIAAGIKAIVAKLRDKLPETKILLLGIFPRGETPADKARQVNIKANELAKTVADNKSVFYLDIGDKFLGPDGSLSKDIMPDRLHLSGAGYEIWAKSTEPKVSELLGDKKVE